MGLGVEDEGDGEEVFDLFDELIVLVSFEGVWWGVLVLFIWFLLRGSK